MHVIFNTVHPVTFATLQLTYSCGHVRMKAVPQGLLQAFCAVLGAEDNMNNDMAEGLRHADEDSAGCFGPSALFRTGSF